MATSNSALAAKTPPSALDRLATARPDLVLVAPIMTYMLLLGLVPLVPPTWQPAVIALRGIGSLAVVWALRHHLPPWGKPYWTIALVSGALCAWGWIVGQYVADQVGLPGRLPLMPGVKAPEDPRRLLGADDLFWATWWLRMLVAVIAVPVVEELFWRAFLLRALIDWQHFDRVPLGKFSWLAFIGSSLISTLQHPDNWVVSIFCWLAFNALFYWTRSILCLILVHGITNLVLYVMTQRVGDWSFW